MPRKEKSGVLGYGDRHFSRLLKLRAVCILVDLAVTQAARAVGTTRF